MFGLDGTDISLWIALRLYSNMYGKRFVLNVCSSRVKSRPSCFHTLYRDAETLSPVFPLAYTIKFNIFSSKKQDFLDTDSNMLLTPAKSITELGLEKSSCITDIGWFLFFYMLSKSRKDAPSVFLNQIHFTHKYLHYPNPAGLIGLLCAQEYGI
jgi:hypothetical protein